MVIPIRHDNRSLKVAVNGPEEAAHVLEVLYRLGAYRKQNGERVQQGGVVDGVRGYWVGASKIVMPILKGEEHSFEAVGGREVTVAEIDRAASLGALLEEGSDGAQDRAGHSRDGWTLDQLPQHAPQSDGLLTQLYRLVQVARRLGLERAADYIESLPSAPAGGRTHP